jgi:uncharacterized protein YbcI
MLERTRVTRVSDATHHQSLTAELSNALVALHKEQFGRGPTRARTEFAGPDIVVTVFHDALLPAERELVSLGEVLRVQEARVFFQEATRAKFIETIERIVSRKVVSFHSTCDARNGVVIEIALLEPAAASPERRGRRIVAA